MNAQLKAPTAPPPRTTGPKPGPAAMKVALVKRRIKDVLVVILVIALFILLARRSVGRTGSAQPMVETNAKEGAHAP